MTSEPPESPAHEVVEALRALRDAEVLASSPDLAELAVDRRVLLEQASPWRYFSGEPFAAPLQAVRAWQRRYRLAYERHYIEVARTADALLEDARAAAPAASALRRLDAISALGPPIGGPALAAYDAARADLEGLPAGPGPGEPRTAGVTLGVEPPLFAEVRAALEAVERGLERQRLRLASETVRAVLARPGVPGLDRLLQAIVASDLDGIERGLTDDLAAHIDRLLRESSESPLAAFARRVPTVTSETLDEAVESFREVLAEALAASEDGFVTLREDAPR